MSRGKQISLIFFILLSLDETLSVTIQMKATEQYFPVVLFIMMYNGVVCLESMGQILKYDLIGKLSSRTSLWCRLFCCVGWFKIFSLWIKSKSDMVRMEAAKQYFSCGAVHYTRQGGSGCMFRVDELLKCLNVTY